MMQQQFDVSPWNWNGWSLRLEFSTKLISAWFMVWPAGIFAWETTASASLDYIDQSMRKPLGSVREHWLSVEPSLDVKCLLLTMAEKWNEGPSSREWFRINSAKCFWDVPMIEDLGSGEWAMPFQLNQQARWMVKWWHANKSSTCNIRHRGVSNLES